MGPPRARPRGGNNHHVILLMQLYSFPHSFRQQSTFSSPHLSFPYDYCLSPQQAQLPVPYNCEQIKNLPALTASHSMLLSRLHPLFFDLWMR